MLTNNYNKINKDVSDRIMKKQKSITTNYSENRELKKKVDQFKRINTESIKEYSNVFVVPLLSKIKSIIEDTLSKDLIYQNKIENERILILNKKLGKNENKDVSLESKNTILEISDIQKTTYCFLNLIKYLFLI